MYSVLIVDDERIVRLALNSIIDWKAHGFQVCASVSNAQTALDEIERLRPHLVITDIVMPDMDGLALIEKARKAGYTGEFVMLTNHQDFSYAVKALKLGAFDYILKTDLSPDAFSAVLDRVCLRLKQNPLLVSPTTETTDQDLTTITSWLENQSSEGILKNEHFFLEIVLRHELSHIPYRGPVNTLKNIIQDVLKLQSEQITIIRSTCAVVSFLSEQSNAFWTELKPRLHSLRERVQLYMNSDCAFVLSHTFHNQSSMQSALEQCRFLHPTVIYKGFGCLLRVQDSISYHSQSIDVSTISAAIQKQVDARHFDEALQIYKKFWENCENSNLAPGSASNASIILQNLLLINNSLWIERAVQDQLFPYTQSFFPYTMKEHIAYFSDTLASIRKVRTKFSLAARREEIAQLDKYIHTHISEHITLSMLSKHVNMTENYLSRMFKAETGLNLITYINLVKLEQARILLAQPGSSIKNISLELGFEEQSYFNKLFNKTYGINPSDYKKLLSHQTDPFIQD